MRDLARQLRIALRPERVSEAPHFGRFGSGVERDDGREEDVHAEEGVEAQLGDDSLFAFRNNELENVEGVGEGGREASEFQVCQKREKGGYTYRGIIRLGLRDRTPVTIILRIRSLGSAPVISVIELSVYHFE